MSDNPEAEGRLYREGSDCLKEFNILCALEAEQGFSWAENQRARFLIWGANLGVFAYGHASLDHRLSKSLEAVEVIEQLLTALKANIVYLTKELKEGSNHVPEANVKDDSESTTSSFTVPSLALADETTDTREITVTTKTKDEIEQELSTLNNIARIVRKPGRNNRDLRAKSYVDRNEDGDDLTSHYSKLATLVINQKFPKASEELRVRISRSVSDRRNRIAYMRNHRKKLGRIRLAEPPAPILPIENIKRTKKLAETSKAPTKAESVVSGTSVTDTAIEVDRIRKVASGGSARALSVVSDNSFQEIELNIPKAPDVEGKDEFVCDYCDILCPAKIASAAHWRGHVLRDIRPYICLFEGCENPEETYESFNEWRAHMQKENNLFQWFCNAPGHQSQIFSSQILLENHIKAEHPGTFAESELPQLAKMGLRSSFQIFDQCLFCPDGVDNGVDHPLSHEGQAVLQRHIARHLQNLALLSTSWLGDVAQSEGASSLKGLSVGRVVENVRKHRARLKFHDPPIPVNLASVEIDPQWGGVLPVAEKLSDDPSWIENLVVEGRIMKPSRDDEWGLLGGPLRSQTNTIFDKKLYTFVTRFLEFGPAIYDVPIEFNGEDDVSSELSDTTSLSSVEADSASTYDDLRSQLYDARIEWPPGRNTYFIPADAIQRLVTPLSILRELQRSGWLRTSENLYKTVEKISSRASKVFAILICQDRGSATFDFFSEGLLDDDLPFFRVEGPKNGLKFELRSRRSPEKPLQCMKSWDMFSIATFDANQWWMLAPIFEKSSYVRHYAFEDRCVLPYIQDDEYLNSAQGGTSAVWGIKVHPAHQFMYRSTYSVNPMIAVKRLHSRSKEVFDGEVMMLKYFTNEHQNPHLVKLLATYSFKGRFYMMFPRANSNLRQFWEQNPEPDFSITTIEWMLQQCQGLASGLAAIHTPVTPVDEDELAGKSTEQQQLFKDELGARSPRRRTVIEKDLAGRHGDIKPENILVEYNENEDNSRLGSLIIADFGLMEFHSLKAGSEIGAGSPTYGPPDLVLRLQSSPYYDVWSLGCVYLEFITWLVAHYTGLSKFPEIRGLTTYDRELNDDAFFTILYSEEGNPVAAIVRESVSEWIRELHSKPRSSRFVHDFLELISQGMLVVDPYLRRTSASLDDSLKSIIFRGKSDPDYLIKPVPWPERSSGIH